MKYLEGEPLDQIIAKLAKGDPAYLQRFTYEHRTEIFMQLLRAVQYAHRRGVLHLDIKPANATFVEKSGPFVRVSTRKLRTKLGAQNMNLGKLGHPGQTMCGP